MVHTEVARQEHIAHATEISEAAFTGAPFHRFIRPRNSEFPDGAFYFSLQRLRKAVISPNQMMRVALADDADPWVDVGLQGRAAEEAKWMRGKLVDGLYESSELVNGTLKDKVPQGRVLGYAIWQRNWPKDPVDAKLVKKKCGAGTVWPGDNFLKKASRAVFTASTKYFTYINPDPAIDPKALSLITEEGDALVAKMLKPAIDRAKHVGYIMLEALAVDPTFHRCGVGARMMRWGIERAETERCPVLLIASSKGRGLYKKFGFEEGEVLTLGELTGDILMVYWPKTFEGADVQEKVTQVVERSDVKAEKETAAGGLAANGTA